MVVVNYETTAHVNTLVLSDLQYNFSQERTLLTTCPRAVELQHSLFNVITDYSWMSWTLKEKNVA